MEDSNKYREIKYLDSLLCPFCLGKSFNKEKNSKLCVDINNCLHFNATSIEVSLQGY